MKELRQKLVSCVVVMTELRLKLVCGVVVMTDEAEVGLWCGCYD